MVHVQHITEFAGIRRAAQPLTIATLADRPGLRLVGEVDLTSWNLLEAELNSWSTGDTDVHLDLTWLTFIDAHGAMLLVRAAERLGPGRSLVLHSPPSVLRRLLELLWHDEDTIKMGTT